MSDKKFIVDLATDIYNGKISGKFENQDPNEVLRKALIEANGGSDKLDYKQLRKGHVTGLFEIIEEILANNTQQGLLSNPFFQEFGEFRDLSAGDEATFHVPDNSLFLVSETAHGIRTSRRQRINKGKNVTVNTNPHFVDTYEEMRRLLAGRMSITEFIDKMQRSMLEDKLALVYDTFYAGLSELPSAFVVNGAYVEASLVDIIQHVQAATGQQPMIVGTMQALRKVTTAVVSDMQKEDVYNLGFYGKFNGTPMMMIPQSHTLDGTYTFRISNDDLWIVATDTKPVKFVTEGEVVMETSDMMKNADGTVDMTVMEDYGAGIVINKLYGQYRIS